MKRRSKYLDLARELKKLWNMKVTIVSIVIGALGTITNGLLKGLEDLEVGGRAETIQTTALLRTARILRWVLETWGDLLSLKLQWKPSAKTDVKNSKGVNNTKNNNRKKNCCMDISSDKQTKSRTRTSEDGLQKEALREILNLFWCQHKKTL